MLGPGENAPCMWRLWPLSVVLLGTPWSLSWFCYDLSSVDNDFLHEFVFIGEGTQRFSAVFSSTINPPMLT